MTQEDALKVLLSGQNVFLTGKPGAGKTHTVNLFVEHLKRNGIRYAVTASTGIAATHIGGTTIHSWAGLGIKREVTEDVLGKILNNDFTIRRINDPQVLIIDEVSMLDATMINNINYVMQQVRGDGPFGGVQIVFVGDFFQLPPVVRGEKEIIFAFEAQAWRDAEPVTCYLTEQHRQSEPEFLEILNAMREGEVTDAHREMLQKKREGEEPKTMLFTHNLDVNLVNNKELLKLPGNSRAFKMESGGNPYLVDRLKEYCLAPDMLKLRIGAVVMFVRNNFDRGYANGTIGTVVEFADNGFPVVELADGGRIIPDMAEWTFEEYGQTKAFIQQIPLRLAWAITVHKSQGMSLDSAVVDLSKCFEVGQGYVAISRVRSLSKLWLQGMNDKVFDMHPKIVEQDKIFRGV